MKVRSLDLHGLQLIEPALFEDARGHFYESFNERRFRELTGCDVRFVQDNVSLSRRNVLRGLHYQIVSPQSKLIQVLSGEIFDVAVDIRQNSPTCGQWTGLRLSGESRQSFWIPAGFAHGYVVLSDSAEILYKVTDYWNRDGERRIVWNDPDLAIAWPIGGEPLLAPADAAAPGFRAAEKYL